MDNIIFVQNATKIMLPLSNGMQTMACMSYFDSSNKQLTYSFKWKSVTEMHVITKCTNLHGYSYFFLYGGQLDGDAIK